MTEYKFHETEVRTAIAAHLSESFSIAKEYLKSFPFSNETILGYYTPNICIRKIQDKTFFTQIEAAEAIKGINDEKYFWELILRKRTFSEDRNSQLHEEVLTRDGDYVVVVS